MKLYMRPKHRGVVRLKTQALWRRLDELNGSQNWLAEEIGISKSYMSFLIRKEKAPSGRVRRRMMEALDLHGFDDLFLIEHPD